VLADEQSLTGKYFIHGTDRSPVSRRASHCILLYPVFAIAKFFVIRCCVYFDRCSGKIEGCDIVSPGKNDCFGSGRQAAG
jgi:hypothetical protein